MIDGHQSVDAHSDDAKQRGIVGSGAPPRTRSGLASGNDSDGAGIAEAITAASICTAVIRDSEEEPLLAGALPPLHAFTENGVIRY